VSVGVAFENYTLTLAGVITFKGAFLGPPLLLNLITGGVSLKLRYFRVKIAPFVCN
jgi:hypothetical protein